MEIVFPVSMLAVGLLAGTVSLWFITRTKLNYEFDRGRADGETERATLTERLARKEDQLREFREALDCQTDQSDHLRAENARTLADLSVLTTRLEEERKASQEKLSLLSNAETKLA